MLGQAPTNQSLVNYSKSKNLKCMIISRRSNYLRQGSFSETHVRSYEGEIQDYTSEPYTYVKTGENTATLEVDEGDGENI